MNLFWVFLGGGCGAASRYLLGLLPIAASFPFITFGINLLGSFLIGLISGWAFKQAEFNQQLILLLQVGFCGGVTTFSTFSLDLCKLLDQGSWALGLTYAIGTVLGCLLCTYLGRTLILSLS